MRTAARKWSSALEPVEIIPPEDISSAGELTQKERTYTQARAKT